MTIEKIYFSATDGIQLFGLLHKSDSLDNQQDVDEKIGINKENKKVVLSVHGMTSNCLKKRENIFAEEYTKNGIDYFCFNNRGADIIGYYERVKEGKLITRVESGTANENFEDSYCDIKGAILMLLEKGYDEIYLQGHSYGSAKSVYTYNKLKENMEIDILSHIKYVVLLSIVDIPRVCRALLGNKYNDVILEIKQMVNEGRGEELIKREYFLHPMSARNFLFFNKIGGVLDLVPFGADNPELNALSNIKCPLMMLWGKERDMIMQKPEILERIIKDNVKNTNLEVRFIEGTGHNYRYKEAETAREIIKTLDEFGKGNRDKNL